MKFLCNPRALGQSFFKTQVSFAWSTGAVLNDGNTAGPAIASKRNQRVCQCAARFRTHRSPHHSEPFAVGRDHAEAVWAWTELV
jgi:hypothetical protein